MPFSNEATETLNLSIPALEEMAEHCLKNIAALKQKIEIREEKIRNGEIDGDCLEEYNFFLQELKQARNVLNNINLNIKHIHTTI